MRQPTSTSAASGRLSSARRATTPPSGTAGLPCSDSIAPTRTMNVALADSPSGSVAVTVTVASPGRRPRSRSVPPDTRASTAFPSADAA